MAAHDWVKSTLGHGNFMCRRCAITDLEADAIGRVRCTTALAPIREVPQAEYASAQIIDLQAERAKRNGKDHT